MEEERKLTVGETDVARILIESGGRKVDGKSLKPARSEAELKALEQRDDAFKQRRIQIWLVSTNVLLAATNALIGALIALKTFGII